MPPRLLKSAINSPKFPHLLISSNEPAPPERDANTAAADAVMKSARYSVSRQKACIHCSAAKAKCDRKSGGCTRCARRDVSCVYTRAADRSLGGSVRGNDNSTLRSPYHSPDVHTRPPGLTPNSDMSVSGNNDSTIFQSAHLMAGKSPTGILSGSITGHNRGTSGPSLSCFPATDGLGTLDFSGLDLVCPINAGDISNRWLQCFIPVPGQKAKEYPANITAFIYRILKSYVSMTVRGRGVPPFVHYSQITVEAARSPLSTCLGLMRMCENPLPGSQVSAMNVLQREMTGIYEHHGTYDDLSLLAAFQAYLIYSLVLFFNLRASADSFLRQAMMNLQDLACSCSLQGLVSVAEQQRVRPKWESWIVAEAKRRTLFTMYLFDSVLLAEDGLPNFLGTELRGLLAPAAKFMWMTSRRHEWEATYNAHLVEWGAGGLRIEELWPIDAGLDEHRVLERRNRVDRWLESVDEFGTMMYAITSCTHGS